MARTVDDVSMQPTSHRLWPLVAAAVAALALTACGGDDARQSTPAATVHMTEFSYSPAELTVPKNSTINVVNDGTVVHTWIVKGAGVGTAGVPPHQSILVDLKDVAPGTYTVYCDQPGHTEQGQSGKLTITG